MYLLYVDESGTTHDPNQQYFVLAGFCVFERQGYWIASQLDQIAARFDPADLAAVELHGSPMFGGRGRWRSYPKEDIAVPGSVKYKLIFKSLIQQGFCRGLLYLTRQRTAIGIRQLKIL